MQDILISPSLMKRSVANDESTTTSNLTMDTRMDVVEIDMGNLHNYGNHMSHLLSKCMKERKQGYNQSSAKRQMNK